MLFQRTKVEFPALTQQCTSVSNRSSRGSSTSSLCRHQACAGYTYIPAGTYIHIK